MAMDCFLEQHVHEATRDIYGSRVLDLVLTNYIDMIENLEHKGNNDGLRVVSSPKGVMQLRQDLVDLYRWSNDWLMLFNTDKHLGNKNPCVKYDLGSRELESILEEKELSILIKKDLKVSAQCSRAAKASNSFEYD